MKIYFLTTQSSKNFKSWSGIPYLMQKNLERRGYEVINIVFRELFFIKFLFNLPIRVINKFYKNKTIYFYVRTPLHFFTTYLISQYVRLISAPDDVMLIQGFSYPLTNKKNKMILVGDWPSEYLFENFLRRKPGVYELGSVRRENAVIESADAVITLFPEVREYMLKKYDNQNIFYFGNVVNLDEDFSITTEFLEKKICSMSILFIGRPYYLAGAVELIECVRELRSEGANFQVDIIGIEKNLLPYEYDWLLIHGYLDKGNTKEKELYYQLLSQAKCFVNTTPKWNAFQATLEAMYFFNPIIIRENPIIKKSFKSLEEFCYLVNEKKDLKDQLKECFKDLEGYKKKSKAARIVSESNTWTNFTSQLIKLIENE